MLTKTLTTPEGVYSHENRNPPVTRGFLYGASRTRTGDLLGAIQALSQLSYSPAAPRVAGNRE
jgi:hypothetical protein